MIAPDGVAHAYALNRVIQPDYPEPNPSTVQPKSGGWHRSKRPKQLILFQLPIKECLTPAE